MMDEETKPVDGFAERMFAYHRDEMNFTDALCDADFGDYNHISGDYYDCSIEFKQVENDARMGEAAQRLCHAAGFHKAYVNHKDGWETHYSWNPAMPFKPARGWRRRYVTDPTASTTNQVGADEPEHRGYYEISYWPEGWGQPVDRPLRRVAEVWLYACRAGPARPRITTVPE
jgi:hypothetical protein